MIEQDSNKRTEIKHIVEALYYIKIAVESLIPDPTQTIKQYRDAQRENRERQENALALATQSYKISIYAAVVATLAALGILAKVFI